MTDYAKFLIRLGIIIACSLTLAYAIVELGNMRRPLPPLHDYYHVPVVEPELKQEKPDELIEDAEVCKEKGWLQVTEETIRKVVDALVQVESGGIPQVGDNGRAVGVLQIWPIAAREISRITGTRFSLEDRWDNEKSKAGCFAVLKHYQKVYGEEDPIRLAARWRNPNGPLAGWYMEKIRKELAK